MGDDDEIAVVLYKNHYYVDNVWGGNISVAVKQGQKFASKEEALEYASHGTAHYGMTYHEPFEFEINEQLENLYKTATNKFWQEELKDSNERKQRLDTGLSVYNLSSKKIFQTWYDKDAQICRLFIDGKLENLDEVVMKLVELDFLNKNTSYHRFRRYPDGKKKAWSSMKKSIAVPEALLSFVVKTYGFTIRENKKCS